MLNLPRYTLYIQAIFDVIALICGFFLAGAFKIWSEKWLPIGIAMPAFSRYSVLLFLSLIAYTVIYLFYLARQDVLNRKFSSTLLSSLKTTAAVMAALIFYLFFTKSSEDFSRIFLFCYALFSFVLMALLREVMNRFILPLFQHSKNAEQILVVGKKKKVEEVLRRIRSSGDWRIKVSAAAFTDVSEVKENSYCEGVRIISGREHLIDSLSSIAADSVLFVQTDADRKDRKLIQAFCRLGKKVHLEIEEFDELHDMARVADEIGGYPVISYLPIVSLSKRYEFVKRLADDCLVILLLPFYGIIYLLSFLAVSAGDGGPVILDRARVGKNGRRFYRHRFRVLRMDAEKRLQMQQSPFTGWGRFLVRTHLDGLPAVINVLGGDMSMCGPYAPKLSEYLSYDEKRRKNLCIKPGIEGEWALPGTEEEIVSRERAYIREWSFLKDLGISAKVIFRYLTGHSYRSYTEEDMAEEIRLISEYENDRLPLSYDHSAYVHHAGIREKIYLFFKRVLDIVLSLAGLIVLSPVLLVIAAAVMADDFGSPIYRHERIGQDGKKIFIYKFRSMRMDAGDLKRLLTPEQYEQYRREYKIDNDPRITPIGDFIRRTSLDELPQLFNILQGSLSIVGPRPIVEGETRIYGREIAKFLSVRPGLTGYWQAYARNNATYETGERQRMELYYVDHRSLLLDIRIFFRTFISVAKKEGAK